MNKTLNKKYGYILDNINGYSLDKYQRKIVYDNHDNVIVVAGAGTGKSTTIIGKVKYLINALGYDPNEILCISFTNESVNSLKNSLFNNGVTNVNVMTFHKLALSIIETDNIIVPNGYLEYIIDELYDIDLDEKKLILTIIRIFRAQDLDYQLFYNIPKKYHDIVLKVLLLIKIYEDEKKASCMIDFDDMIKIATNNINVNKYKYIIIDEYQDSSLLRVNLIKKLIGINNAKLLVVGDDYQSIYEFSGTDINIFLNFRKYFKKIKTYKLVNTYRNCQELINVAGGFILKNPYQIKKRLISNKSVKKPFYVYYYKNKCVVLKKILDSISDNKNILVLGRNNFNINNYLDKDIILDNNKILYKNKNIQYLTIHKSKGLEEDEVIILDCNNETYGIPSLVKEEKILKYFKTKKNYFKFSEERRIFYVAMTRSKNNVYFLVNKKNPSIFIKELLKGYSKYINIIY